MNKKIKPEITVEIAGSCYYNILRSIIEGWPYEVIGDLIGKQTGNRFILINSYHWLTAVRKYKEAWYGNYAARVRMISFDRVIRDFGYCIVGCFHTHIFFPDHKRESYFSMGEKYDYGFFSDEMAKLHRIKSVMIVASIRVKEYRKKQVPGEYISQYRKSLRVIVKDNPYHGYDIILTAFLLRKNKKTLERLKIRRRYVKISKIKCR